MRTKELYLLFALFLLGLFIIPTSAGIPTYPGKPGPHASLLFPVVRDTFVELHYAPVVRLENEGVFLTTQETLRRMPAKPETLTILNPLTVAQQDATVVRGDSGTGLILIRPPFGGPVYSLAQKTPRPGDKVILRGSPYRQMSHIVPIEHRVPDLRPVETRGRISGDGEVTRTGPPVPYGIGPGWAVLDAKDRELLGLIVRTKGEQSVYVSAEKIRSFLNASGLLVP